MDPLTPQTRITDGTHDERPDLPGAKNLLSALALGSVPVGVNQVSTQYTTLA